jgi:hypothetical protein
VGIAPSVIDNVTRQAKAVARVTVATGRPIKIAEDIETSRELNMTTRFLIAGALVAGVAVHVDAQLSYKKAVPDSLAKQAKVAESAAARTALARVPKGAIQGVELENENGKLIYSYDIKTAGKRGSDEVHVDAMTGKIVAFAHETPADEKKEAAAAKAAKKPKKP